jgi:mRNA-degrading endonuclease RelE of RelBE toxin-antitoxin system
MSDHIARFVRRLTPKQRRVIEELILRIGLGELNGLDVKKLVGERELYRVRKGNIRIVFGAGREIIDIDFRGNIYKK